MEERMSSGALAKNAAIKAAASTGMDAKQVGQFADWWANPAVIGLMGFSLTTMAVGLNDVFAIGIGAPIALAIAFGGLAQFIAGWIDLRKGSLFGGSAFVAYGAFWFSFALFNWLLPTMGMTMSSSGKLVYLLMWTMFTLSFCIAVLKVGKYLSVLFWLLLLAFVLLDCVTLGWVPAQYAGVEIVLTGLVAWYIATATLTNGVHGKTVLPLS
jgi:uncharacterized protein